MPTLPPELLELLAAHPQLSEFGKTTINLSRHNGAVTKAEVMSSIPEHFKDNNAAAMGHVARKLRDYQAERANGEITLVLKYRDGNLVVVTENRTW